MQQHDKLNSAVNTAVNVASSLGLSVANPQVLQYSNHVSILLQPYPVVARVLLNVQEQHGSERLLREIEICRYLNDRGAPAVSPTVDLDSGPHICGDIGLTFWQFIDHRHATDHDWPTAKIAYQELRRHLNDYSGSLPVFLDRITECTDVLSSQRNFPSLNETDLSFLRMKGDQLLVQLREFDYSMVPLHGDPHLGNLLVRPTGPIWADFEAACMGPLEWDLSCFPISENENWSINGELHGVMRSLRSFCVVVWCSMAIDTEIGKQGAAAYHLHQLKTGQ